MSKLRSMEEHETQPQNHSQNCLKKSADPDFAIKCKQNLLFTQLHSNLSNKQQNFGNQIYENTIRTTNDQEQCQSAEFHESQQLKSTLLQKMDSLYNSLSREHFGIFQDLGHIDQASQLDDVEDYILTICSSNLQQVPRLLSILQQNTCLRQFLQWIFDASPLLFYQDLILVACRLILIGQSYETTQNLQEAMNSFASSHIISHIFNDPSLKILNIVYQNKSCHSKLLAPLDAFLSYYTQTLLQLRRKGRVQNEETSQSQSQVRTKKSKKIKKGSKY